MHDIATASRNLVKSQCTWFRDDDMFQWMDVTAPAEDVFELIMGEINQPEHQGMYVCVLVGYGPGIFCKLVAVAFSRVATGNHPMLGSWSGC